MLHNHRDHVVHRDRSTLKLQFPSKIPYNHNVVLGILVRAHAYALGRLQQGGHALLGSVASFDDIRDLVVAEGEATWVLEQEALVVGRGVEEGGDAGTGKLQEEDERVIIGEEHPQGDGPDQEAEKCCPGEAAGGSWKHGDRRERGGSRVRTAEVIVGKSPTLQRMLGNVL